MPPAASICVTQITKPLFKGRRMKSEAKARAEEPWIFKIDNAPAPERAVSFWVERFCIHCRETSESKVNISKAVVVICRAPNSPSKAEDISVLDTERGRVEELIGRDRLELWCVFELKTELSFKEERELLFNSDNEDYLLVFCL